MVEAISVAIDFCALARLQKQDVELRILLQNERSSLNLQKIPVSGSSRTLYCDVFI